MALAKSSIPARSLEKSGDNMVFALHQAARVVPGGHVTQPDIMRQGSKERNSLSNENRHASDDQALDESRAQEPLYRDPTIDVEMVGASVGELRNDVSRSSGHLFDNAAGRGQIDGATAQDHDALVAIWPGP